MCNGLHDIDKFMEIEEIQDTLDRAIENNGS